MWEKSGGGVDGAFGNERDVVSVVLADVGPIARSRNAFNRILIEGEVGREG